MVSLNVLEPLSKAPLVCLFLRNSVSFLRLPVFYELLYRQAVYEAEVNGCLMSVSEGCLKLYSLVKFLLAESPAKDGQWSDSHEAAIAEGFGCVI
jgi:hypothetical protein